jgi:hypothetical protein
MVGEHCRFCPAYNLCPALQKETYEFAIDIEPSHIPNDQIWALREKAAALAKYGDRLEEDAFRRRMRGEIVPGCKVVRKKANRVFKESIVEPNPDDPQNPVVLRFEDEAIRIFKDDAYQPKAFRTPPAIQKLDGGKAFVSKWAYKPDTGLTLAPDSDKRSEVKRPMEMYMDLIDQVSDEDSEAPY